MPSNQYPASFNGGSAASAQTATALWIKYYKSASVQVTIASGTNIAGTLTVNGTNDFGPENLAPYYTPSNWSPIPNAVLSVTGNGTVLSPPFPIEYTYIQIVWTPSAGTGGTVNVITKVGSQPPN